MSGDAHGGGGGLPGLGAATNLLHSSHEKGGLHATETPFIIAFIVITISFFTIAPAQSIENFKLLFFLAPLWVPAVLTRFTMMRFVQANRARFIANQKHVLLELRMPRDTQKTPLAMETVFSSLHLGPGEATWYKRLFNGSVRPWFSFEIASIGGRIHFYVQTREGLRRAVESAFYAQYPDMEIIEAEDYSKLVEPTAHDWSMFGCEYNHGGTTDAYPIKTYIDFGLDKAGSKPEEQTDPMAQMIEAMGSIGPDEQFWLQFIIRVTKSEKYKGKLNAKGKPYTWKDAGREEIEKIREGAQVQSEYTDPATGEVKKIKGFPNMTEGEKDKLKTIDRNISKLGFDVGIRSIYTAPADKYHGGTISSQIGLFKPFSSEAYNSIGVQSRLSARFNDWPWEDPGGHHKHHEQHLAVEMYRRRQFFHDPYVGDWAIMSTEELATVFHVPTGSIETPGLPRIQSTTSGSPSNLPL